MNRIDLNQRFSLVIQDQMYTLERLRLALKHVADTNPAAQTLVILCNNLVVGLAAISEEALREIFLEYVRVAEECELNFFDFRLAFKRASYEGAVTSLRSKIDWKDRSNNFSDILSKIRELTKLLDGETAFKLEGSKIVDNQGNMRSSQVTEIAKKIGLSDLWSKTAESHELSEYFGVDNRERIQEQTIQKWNELFDERNRVVHRVSEANGWSIEVIDEYIDFVKLVVSQIGVAVETECWEWLSSATTANQASVDRA